MSSEKSPVSSKSQDPESPESPGTPPTSPLAPTLNLGAQSPIPIAASRNITYPPWSKSSQMKLQDETQAQFLQRLGPSLSQNVFHNGKPLQESLDRILSSLSVSDLDRLSNNTSLFDNGHQKSHAQAALPPPSLGPIAPPSQQQLDQQQLDQQQANQREQHRKRLIQEHQMQLDLLERNRHKQTLMYLQEQQQQQHDQTWSPPSIHGLTSSIWSPAATKSSSGWPSLAHPRQSWTTAPGHQHIPSSATWPPRSNSSATHLNRPASTSPVTEPPPPNKTSHAFLPVQTQTQTQSSGFQPMHAVLNSNSSSSNNRLHALAGSSSSLGHIPVPRQTMLSQPPTPTPMPSNRFSMHYHGMHNDSNASAEYLPDNQNCALWLTNLPPKVTTNELLQSIRNIGRIWCTFINQPDNVMHLTAAAKVVFFSPEAAQSLLYLSCTEGLTVRGYRVKVSHNRIKYPAHLCVGKTSRVLIITGQSFFVNEESLAQYFGERFVFQIDQVNELIRVNGRAVVEYRFGSYRCQAQMGKMSLEKDRPPGFEKVEFGDDPCEVGDRLTSYGIAGDRIQGIGL